MDENKNSVVKAILSYVSNVFNKGNKQSICVCIIWI